MSKSPESAGSHDRRSIWSWALYDFANSPFTTLVVTFIYPVFFARVIVGDEIEGTAIWSRAVTLTAILVAILSPLLGALADRGGYRKEFLLGATAACIAGTSALYFIGAGQVMQAFVCFVLANTAFEMGMVFYNAYLPDVASPERIGRISGYGWALGYGGGLLALVVALVTLVQPEVPWFGFVKDQGENVRATNLLVAGWFLVFSIPIFLFVKDDVVEGSDKSRIVRETIGQLRETVRELGKYRQIVRFLIARLIYNDGLVTIFAFGGIYAAGTFGFELEDILIFGIVLNVTSGLGAFGLGFLDDWLGGKRTLEITLVGLIAATLLAVLAPNRFWFWISGIVLGIFVGPNQAASRSLLGRMVPDDKENEFFGFFAFSGKLTAFIGPLMLGILTQAFDSQRAGIAIVLVLFVLGLILLARVDEREGIELAGR